MFAKSGSNMNNSLNASLLAAAGIDARLLSQMSGGYGGSSGNSVAKARESPKPRPPEPETKETQAQRQAAAKLALRKQLEKTLLQVRGHTGSTRARASIFTFPPHLHLLSYHPSPCHLHYFHIDLHELTCSFPDPTPQAPSAGDALHPEPCEHGVHLPDGAGGVRQPDPEP